MVLVRNVFKLKFGQAKEAIPAWKEIMVLSKKLGFNAKSTRLMTDVVGDFYTVVFEHTFDSLAELESSGKTMMANPEWQTAYAKIIAVTESGRREVFNIVMEQ
jgi:hypothetical protein